ncbi:hypothetical protein [Methylobacter sp. BBA5.1]|uniref:hypothetical protein n=1 Tax=Methylobacter sp. BBA5.1 TaxID=1495064 RepID=UPI000563408E|nr:hypothetical protein [Methylobacter sp. BBA5.1]
MWWFDADVLIIGFIPQGCFLIAWFGKCISRIYFSASDKKEAIRNLLRELLAISKEWNLKEKVWALEVPPEQTVKAFKAMDSPQKLFNDIPLSAMGNRMLVDRA